jgi:hypothetical protein
MTQTLRAVAIVFNILALGAIALQIRSEGFPSETGVQLLFLVLIGAPASSLIAFFAKH